MSTPNDIHWTGPVAAVPAPLREALEHMRKVPSTHKGWVVIDGASGESPPFVQFAVSTEDLVIDLPLTKEQGIDSETMLKAMKFLPNLHIVDPGAALREITRYPVEELDWSLDAYSVLTKNVDVEEGIDLALLVLREILGFSDTDNVIVRMGSSASP